jgi:hypothetical protein
MVYSYILLILIICCNLSLISVSTVAELSIFHIRIPNLRFIFEVYNGHNCRASKNSWWAALGLAL